MRANMKTSALGPQRVFLFGVAIALMLAQAGPVSAQMNEGTLSGTLAAFGTVETTATGKERLVLAFDENGLSVTNGPDVALFRLGRLHQRPRTSAGILRRQRSSRRPGRIQLGVGGASA